MSATPTIPGQGSPVTPSALILPPPALEPLLDQVTAPNADLDAIAESHNLTRADLARILESSEAQPLLAALRNLYALHHEFQAYHHSLTLAHTLCEAARAATNPTDKRLAATAALRALYPASNRARSASECPSCPTPQRGGGQVHARHEPGGGASPHPRQPTKAAEGEAEKEAEAERVPERSFGSPATPATPPTPPTSPTPRATPAQCATAVPAVRPQDTRSNHPRATSPQRPHSVSSSLRLSVSSPTPLDRALNRRRPRIETLTRAGAPPDTS